MQGCTGAPPLQKELKILLVDDDDGDAKAVRRAFRKANIANEITRAVDGIAALDILRGTGGKAPLTPPYVLLADINMPRMNGIELVRELRNDPELHSSVVFFLTTSSDQQDIAAAYNLNAAGYIAKETAGRDFLQLVNMMDRYWRIIEPPAPEH
ncbi:MULTISPECIES: response regulator [unclassified Leisingera]|uniref:response regulator n=1 Tax=unclassified Leisingera TaxID=2614906 RepID=UPI00057DE058|nr:MULTISPECIES: response regulator [unclassified Leisingera]KIC14384.1 chemotaxis protein CheY [Leisingera sp. ANG-DT]KIC24109.1 chemotaxis protein CheY [Leisingera sp. ANG-M6]